MFKDRCDDKQCLPREGWGCFLCATGHFVTWNLRLQIGVSLSGVEPQCERGSFQRRLWIDVFPARSQFSRISGGR